MPPFIPTNGLAGDVVVIEGITKRRQIEISSLGYQVIELDKAQDKETKAIEGENRRRTKDLERQLWATTQERSKKLKGLKVMKSKRKRAISSRRRDIELEIIREGKAKEVLERRIKDIENQLDATTKKLSKKLEELEIAYSTRTGPIIERIEELQRLNDYDRSLVAPIRKLPAELLGYVFKHHVDLDNSPWVLTLVSKSWRHTAMTTPSLWVNLLLCSAEHRMASKPNVFESWRIDKSCWYSMGRRVVCHDPSELNASVSCVGSLPLEIHLSYRSDNASMIQFIFEDTAIARRIASLTIYGLTPLGRYSILDVAEIKLGSLPLIHTLTLYSVPEKFQRDILKSISSSSPRLKHFTTYHSIALPLNFSFWSKLRSLNLHGGSNGELLNDLVPHLRNLEILEGCPPRWPDTFTPEVALAKLKTLEVFCLPKYLRKLRLPALLHLTISEEFRRAQIETDGEPLISLPTLESLEVESWEFPSWLAVLSTPCLRAFILRQRGMGRIVEASLFQKLRFPTVQYFTLEYPCTNQMVIFALECVPNAKRVAVSCTKKLYDEPWGLGILQRLEDTENMLCPNMTHFTLGSPSNRVAANKTSVKARARKAIMSRMDGGAKMDHFEIHFKAREESVQYA